MTLPSKSPRNAPPSNEAKVSQVAAGYMELEGAVKDAGCQVVNVKNGISSERSCCNLFDPVKGVKEFKCGNCEFLEKGN